MATEVAIQQEPMLTLSDTSNELTMKEYTATREKLITMDATILCGTSPYAKITTSTFSTKGTLTLSEDQLTYTIRKKKTGSKGLILYPPGENDDTGIARAWRDGVLSKSMHVVIGGYLYRMVSAGFLSTCFNFYRVCSVDLDINNDEDNEKKEIVLNVIKDVKDTTGEKVGDLKKDGFFKKSYSMNFVPDLPAIFPALALWLSTMFEREDAAFTGAAAGAGAGAF